LIADRRRPRSSIRRSLRAKPPTKFKRRHLIDVIFSVSEIQHTAVIEKDFTNAAIDTVMRRIDLDRNAEVPSMLPRVLKSERLPESSVAFGLCPPYWKPRMRVDSVLLRAPLIANAPTQPMTGRDLRGKKSACHSYPLPIRDYSHRRPFTRALACARSAGFDQMSSRYLLPTLCGVALALAGQHPYAAQIEPRAGSGSLRALLKITCQWLSPSNVLY
jgi:hypothetical protein